jgi:hypothetical protein
MLRESFIVRTCKGYKDTARKKGVLIILIEKEVTRLGTLISSTETSYYSYLYIKWIFDYGDNY